MAQWLIRSETIARVYPPPSSVAPSTWTMPTCWGEEHSVADVSEGDPVALLRRGRGGGIVGHGRVGAVTGTSAPYIGHPRCCWRRVTVALDQTYFGNPISFRILPGIDYRVRERFARDKGDPRPPLALSEHAWQVLLQRAAQARDVEWPASWDLSPGTAVSRTDIHKTYGGHRQGVITHSASTPNTFVFLGAGSFVAPFTHDWAEDGALLIVGKPTLDNQLSENLTVLEHIRSGRPLRVFHTRRGKPCVYLGEALLDQEQPIQDWIEVSSDPARRYPVKPRRNPFTGSVVAQNDREPLRAPLIRVFPVTGLAPFVDPDHIPQRRLQSLQLRVKQVADTSERRPIPGAEALVSSGPGQVEADMIRYLVALLRKEPVDYELVEMADTAALVDLIRRHSRQAALTQLRSLVETPHTKEPAIQRVLENQTWVFGGEYVGISTRRAFSLGDRLDIPLVRGDGSLHGVEIKRANVPDLITSHRGRPAVGTPVHLAVIQAMNYLRGLDEQRSTILSEFGVDCRRASMTVVIGHPMYVTGFTRDEIAESVRTYNSHLSRVRVITYAELLDNAARMLLLSRLAADPAVS